MASLTRWTPTRNGRRHAATVGAGSGSRAFGAGEGMRTATGQPPARSDSPVDDT